MLGEDSQEKDGMLDALAEAVAYAERRDGSAELEGPFESFQEIEQRLKEMRRKYRLAMSPVSTSSKP